MYRENFEQDPGRYQAAIKTKWNKITDEDLARVGNNWGQLIGWIQQKYGGTRDDIERNLRELVVAA